ncbi:MAG: 4Fe-4S binding protein [Bacillota bacterium]
MTKTNRNIISIDEEKCDGCGLCITGCPEGALRIIDGKARLVKESFCDGLGACLGECPRGALRIVEREAEGYDFDGVIERLKKESPELLERHLRHMKEQGIEPERPRAGHGALPCASVQVLHGDKSRLRQWPIKLQLVPPDAPFFQDADLALVADCVPFTYADMHGNFLEGRAIATGCPKFDDIAAHENKLAQIIKQSGVKSIKVLHMEVPCCSGLVRIAREALTAGGRGIPFESVTIGVNGEVRGGG